MTEVYDKDIIFVNPATGESRTIKASTDPKVFYRSVAASCIAWFERELEASDHPIAVDIKRRAKEKS